MFDGHWFVQRVHLPVDRFYFFVLLANELLASTVKPGGGTGFVANKQIVRCLAWNQKFQAKHLTVLFDHSYVNCKFTINEKPSIIIINVECNYKKL